MFGAWNLIGIAVIYTFAVEVSLLLPASLYPICAPPHHFTRPITPANLQTKQLSLEEMSEVFDAPRPKLRSFELAAVARERVKKEKELLRARE
jgi:hypothetical protein